MEECIAASFVSIEWWKKTVKGPVGRPRKRPLESDCQAQTDKENVTADGEKPASSSVKSIRCLCRHGSPSPCSKLPVPAIIGYRYRVELHMCGSTVSFHSN